MAHEQVRIARVRRHYRCPTTGRYRLELEMLEDYFSDESARAKASLPPPPPSPWRRLIEWLKRVCLQS